MPIMRFQFSLATLLVCITVLAVVAAISIKIPVSGRELIPDPVPFGLEVWFPFSRPPKLVDIALRMALWGPVAVTATLAVLWAIRRLKFRRENGPPVG
jgi:hypothetical protein